MAKNWSTILLLDPRKPKRLLLLKRGPDRKFAPNLYTGLGGKIEEGESPHAAAIRELEEEAGLTGITLVQFGKLVINDAWVIHQFIGEYRSDSVPDCTEGVLEWVEPQDVMSKELIPTAKIFLEEWEKRGWDQTRPFTVFVRREALEDLFSKIVSIKIEEGLSWPRD
jgi:8-oxo-dGTP diphosphatase